MTIKINENSVAEANKAVIVNACFDLTSAFHLFGVMFYWESCSFSELFASHLFSFTWQETVSVLFNQPDNAQRINQCFIWVFLKFILLNVFTSDQTLWGFNIGHLILKCNALPDNPQSFHYEFFLNQSPLTCTIKLVLIQFGKEELVKGKLDCDDKIFLQFLWLKHYFSFI